MEPKPPDFADLYERQDREQLQILSILHYVLAGISAVIGCFPLLHLTFGLILIGSASTMPGSEERAPLVLFGGFFAVFAALIVLLMWGQALLLFLAGRNLVACRHHFFCMLVAAFTCLHFPFGTALGVFTILVLQRESVRARFAANDQPFAMPPPKF